MKWTENDLKQFKEHEISEEIIDQQIINFKNGFPFTQLVKAAKISNGIKLLSDSEIDTLKSKYEKNKSLSICKFVPASGAATRMFKALFEFESAYNLSECNPALLENEAYVHVKEFFEQIEKFAFYPEMESILNKEGKSIKKLMKENRCNEILDVLLGNKGLNYRNLPKGLLHFHLYPDGSRTPVEEHLVEGTLYGKNPDGTVNIHFTVSPEHMEIIRKLIESAKKRYEDLYQVKYNIFFSLQKPSTDTIAVDKENNPFRENDGSLLFRPAGHGALLENLNDLDDDIIFIKNVDNIVPDKIKDTTVLYKKVLGGLLVECRENIFRYLHMLDSESGDIPLSEIEDFVKHTLCIEFHSDKMNDDEKKKFLYQKLNRPIRICGMVKNVGEPGGGPFWAKNSDNTVSLQIVETSQVNLKAIEQRAIFDSSTHFNPVDIVCSIKDYKNKKFDLHKYRDPNTGFISKKSKNGRSLKAQELPGLWNGSMADWNTVFVEVPLITFNPVKIVNDLLRPEHQ